MRRGRRLLSSLAVAVTIVGGVVCLRAQSATQWPKQSMPAPLQARPIAFPPYELKTLANGLQVLVVTQHEEPSVSFRVLIRAGAVQEPPNRPGVASFVAGLLTQGTTTRSAEAIADAIDMAGGLLSTGSGNELTFVNGAVIDDQTDLALSLAADVVEHPSFAPEEIDRERRQALSALDVNRDDPDYVATAVFNRLAFGLNPYGRPNEGTAESIAHLTRDDLVAFHRTWFAPNNALLAIVGDITPEQGFAAVDRAFGSWTRHDVPATAPPDPPAPARRIVVVDRPGSAQTEIRVGHLAPARTTPDYVPLDLAIRILGGEGANRLFGVLRTSRGLTYGAQADYHAFRTGGDIVAETNTRSDQTVEVLRLIVDQFDRLRDERVSGRELRGAQEYLEGSFPLTIETPSAIALQVLNQLFYGLDVHELETYRQRVDKVSPADIQRVAQAYVMPDRLTIVLVGDAGVFVDELKALGFGEADRIPIADLDLGSPTLRRGSRP